MRFSWQDCTDGLLRRGVQRQSTVAGLCLAGALAVLIMLSYMIVGDAYAACAKQCSTESRLTGLARPPVWAAGRRVHFEAASPGASAYTPFRHERIYGQIAPSSLEGPEAAESGEQLIFHEGGKGVQHTPKVYVIFWGGNFEETTAGQEVHSMLLKLYEGLTGTAYQGILTQYFDTTGRVSSSATVASYIDKSVKAPKTVNRSAVEKEVEKAIETNKWTSELTAQFDVITAPESTYESGFLSGACAYHEYTSGGVIYGFVPYQGDPPFSTNGCIETGNPSKNPIKKTSKSASHEYAEAATDPHVDTWYSSTGAEIADICSNEADFELPDGAWAQEQFDDHLLECSHEDEKPPHAYAVTEAASSIASTTAMLNGVTNAEGAESHYYFEYGPTTSYGSHTTETSAGKGTTNVKVSQTITGLFPESTYHYRLVAVNSTGATHGTDHTLSTLTPSWELETTPNPTGSSENHLEGVSCTSLTNCIATGWKLNSSGAHETLAEQWNGTKWSLMTTPNPTGAKHSYLYGVSCSSATACTAVYTYMNSEGTWVPLAERWNGTEWKVQTPAIPSGAKLSSFLGVSCSSGTECTAVGFYENSSSTRLTLAERWNGTEWVEQTTPNPSGAKASVLYGVSCTSTTTCAASGYYKNSTGTYLTLSESWNGSEWVVQTTPNPAGTTESALYGVSCSSSTACTATGYYITSGERQTLAERWNGAEWKVQTSPNPTGATAAYFTGVGCTSSTWCTGTGAYVNSSGAFVTLAEHWNGTEWTAQTTPNPSGAKRSVFGGVSCVSTACMSAGTYTNTSGTEETLAETTF